MKEWSRRKKMVLLFMGLLVIVFLVGYMENQESVLSEDGHLLRQENGEGGYEVELLLEVDGTEEREFSIVVPEQYLTLEEEENYLAAAIEEIEAGFPGENISFEDIRDSVNLQTSYLEGKVLAEWEFSNYRLIGENGIIVESEMSADQEMVGARVYLTCEDSSRIFEFYFMVHKSEKSEEELFYEKLNQFISENGEAEGTELLWLPTNLEGHTLAWKAKKSELPIQVFFLGIVVILLVPGIEQERKKKECERRKEQLMREYPEMVNKLTLLLGAGMTLQGAWRRIVSRYIEERDKRGGLRKEVYEEMLITQREMESGKGDMKSYEAFGERCGIQKYRKFSRYLTQNLKKGNRELCQLLEREAEEAFAERKAMARKYGEEAGTKLLIPMLLMLGIVVVVIMVPAVVSFQSGIN